MRLFASRDSISWSKISPIDIHCFRQLELQKEKGPNYVPQLLDEGTKSVVSVSSLGTVHAKACQLVIGGNIASSQTDDEDANSWVDNIYQHLQALTYFLPLQGDPFLPQSHLCSPTYLLGRLALQAKLITRGRGRGTAVTTLTSHRYRVIKRRKRLAFPHGQCLEDTTVDHGAEWGTRGK